MMIPFDRRWLMALLTSSSLLATGWNSLQAEDPSPPAVMSAAAASETGVAKVWREFRARNGEGWSATWDHATGIPAILEGGSAKVAGGSPEEMALDFFAKNGALFGLSAPGMKLHFVSVRAGTTAGGDGAAGDGGVTVGLQLFYQEMEVLEAGAEVEIAKDQRVTRVTAKLAHVAGLNLRPGISAETAKLLVAGWGARGTLKPVGEPRLAIARMSTGRLVYAVDAQITKPLPGREKLEQALPTAAQRVLVDAGSGKIVELPVLLRSKPPSRPGVVRPRSYTGSAWR